MSDFATDMKIAREQREKDDARLGEIKERIDKATDGPWEWRGEMGLYQVGADLGYAVLCAGMDGELGGDPLSHNEKLISHAGSDIPWMIDLIERLKIQCGWY